MSIARRQLVQMLGALPLVGDQIVKTGLASASETLGKVAGLGDPAALLVGSRAPRSHKKTEAQEMAQALLGGDPWVILRQADRDLQDEDEELAKMRIGGVDPDIAALKSTAPSYKAMKQRARSLHTLALRKRVDLLLEVVDGF